jgi:hypothetical protein
MVRFASLTSTLQNFVPLGLGGFLSGSVFGCGCAAPSVPYYYPAFSCFLSKKFSWVFPQVI